MKKYLKRYAIAALISLVGIILPWVLEYLGVFSAMDVLEYLGILFALVALVVTVIYTTYYVKEMKPRILIILLNPAIYYIIALIIIGIMIASASWNGFNLIFVEGYAI